MPGVPDEIRERMAKALWCWDAPAWADEQWDAMPKHAREDHYLMADAVLAVLDRDALIAMLGAEQVGMRSRAGVPTTGGGPDECWHGPQCSGTGPDCDFRAPVSPPVPSPSEDR